MLPFAQVEERLLYVFSAIALVAITSANHMHIETDDHIKLAPKLELLLRLGATGCGGLVGLYGFFFIKRVRTAFLTFPAAWVLGIWLLYLTSTIFSPFRSVAFPHLVTFTSVVLFAPTAFAVLGTRKTILLIIGSLIFTLLASWFLYLAMPEYGVMVEFTDESGAGVERMAGMSHPNVLAGTSVLCMVMVVYLIAERKLSLGITLPVLTLCLVTLAMTGTRVAILAAVASLFTVYRGFWFRKNVFPFTALGIAIAILGALFVLSEDSGGMASRSVMRSVTRSGNMDEITSVTGRAEIWEFCIEKIGERPIRGWGPGSAKPLLEKEDTLLHTHNVILHMAIVGGVLGGVFVVLLFLQQAMVSIRGTYPLAALISIVILMNSMTENPIFDYIPGAPTLLWMIAIFWPVLDDGSL